jgi:hypothetical protein
MIFILKISRKRKTEPTLSKHTAPKAKAAGVASEGVRLSGPGTRSKNPYKYDKNAHMSKNYKGYAQ